MLQSYTRSGSSPASLTEVMDHPPFEEHLLQHTLWPEVEKLQVLLIIPFNHLSITHTIISYYQIWSRIRNNLCRGQPRRQIRCICMQGKRRTQQQQQYNILSMYANLILKNQAATPEHAVVRIFETGNWKELPGKVAGHTLTVTRARFSHNDRWLLTASRDRMWCLSERKDDDPGRYYKPSYSESSIQ